MNHSEIAETITNTLFEPGQFPGKKWCKERITAALDQAYERGVRESAEAGVKYVRRLTTFQDYSACGLADAILSLLAPPVPVWQHKPDCPTPYRWDGQAQVWLHGVGQRTAPTARFCDGCGAPKPDTKGS